MATKWQKVKSNLYFLNNERIVHSLPGGARLGWERLSYSAVSPTHSPATWGTKSFGPQLSPLKH